jgi:signal transduction histidine kinase
MVYGRRATPYEVLSSFSQQMAAVDPAVLGQMARMLTEGTTASAASIWMVRKKKLHRIAVFPEKAANAHIADDEPIPDADQNAEVTHDGERLGLIALELPAGQPFPPADRTLLDQVAGGLGLALRNLQLTEDLRARVDELRESRRRVVAVQDQTRQMLERDLHDGAQQRLVALKIKVGLGAAMALKQGLTDVGGILETVRSEADLTIDSLRNLARGIYPPLLESEGLAAALTAQLRRAPLPVTVQAAGIRRQPREIEATVYFCVLEAVQNAIKHARAKSVLVTVTDDDDHLDFEVRDDGTGFDRNEPSAGSGLQNMADRLDALNGVLDVSTSPGHGTRIVGRIPVREVAAK